MVSLLAASETKDLRTAVSVMKGRAAKGLTGFLRQPSIRTHSSHISPIAPNLAFIREKGITEFARRAIEKQKFLTYLIDNYNDGRTKSFFCTSCQLLPLEKLGEAVSAEEATLSDTSDIKEKAKIIRGAISTLADNLKIDLRLRK